MSKTQLWLRSAGAAAVSGVANSFLTGLGITGAQIVGIQVEQLNARQLVATTVVGGLVGLALFLKQSPLPPEG